MGRAPWGEWFRAAKHIKGVRKMVDELKRARRIACLAVVSPQGEQGTGLSDVLSHNVDAGLPLRNVR